MKSPLVSIIITTKNEEKNIARLLESIEKQSYKRLETIVVDNNSSDLTKKVSLKYTKRVYDFGPERSAQRNFGAKKAKGIYLVFLDADMELSKRVIEECVNTISGNDKTAGIIIPEQSIGNRYWEKVKAYERSFYNLQGDDISDAARFFKKELFQKVKGYDEKITGPEDWDLPERIKKKGYRISRIKSVIYHYEKIESLSSLAKKKYYYGLKSHVYLNKGSIKILSPKTIYFLRPVFYRNWQKLLANPFLSLSMIFMLIVEQISGGLGFLIGKMRKL